MVTSTFIGVKEIQELLGVSSSKAYGVIHDLNGELSGKGFMIVPGRVSRQYFNERFYGIKTQGREEGNAGI